MLELRRDREARMAAHFEQLRGPIPDFEVGDALELRVSAPSVLSAATAAH